MAQSVWRSLVEFPERLAKLRKDRGLSQRQLADAIAMHVSQVRRYEAGSSQPTLDALKKIAVTLGVSADVLLFGEDKRGPDDDLRLQFEALQDLDPDDKQVVKKLLDALILQHQAKRWTRVG